MSIIGKPLTVSGGGGTYPSLRVDGLSSTDTVTATKGSKTLTAAWKAVPDSTTNAWYFDKIPEFGAWTVTATDGTQTATQEVLVDMATEFAVTMSLPLFGDGTNNSVTNGYNGKLMLNGENWDPDASAASTGNFNMEFYAFRRTIQGLGLDESTLTNIVAGTNNIAVSWDAGSADLSIFLGMAAGTHGYASTGAALSNLKFTCDGSAKTLSELVQSGTIKPMVLIAHAGGGSSYLLPTAVNLYSGGSSGNSTYSYVSVGIYFILNKGHAITNVGFSSLRALSQFGDGDGVSYFTGDTDTFLISMREEE